MRRQVSFPVLEAIDDEERRLVLAEARRRRFSRNEVILHARDPADALHLISEGRVMVRRSSGAGGTSTLAFLGPGEFFGELALVAAEPQLGRTATVQAVEPTETLSIRADRFADLRRRHPQMDRFLVELLAARVAELDDLLVEALQLPAEMRVLRRLAAAAEQFGLERPVRVDRRAPHPGGPGGHRGNLTRHDEPGPPSGGRRGSPPPGAIADRDPRSGSARRTAGRLTRVAGGECRGFDTREATKSATETAGSVRVI